METKRTTKRLFIESTQRIHIHLRYAEDTTYYINVKSKIETTIRDSSLTDLEKANELERLQSQLIELIAATVYVGAIQDARKDIQVCGYLQAFISSLRFANGDVKDFVRAPLSGTDLLLFRNSE